MGWRVPKILNCLSVSVDGNCLSVSSRKIRVVSVQYSHKFPDKHSFSLFAAGMGGGQQRKHIANPSFPSSLHCSAAGQLYRDPAAPQWLAGSRTLRRSAARCAPARRASPAGQGPRWPASRTPLLGRAARPHAAVRRRSAPRGPRSGSPAAAAPPRSRGCRPGQSNSRRGEGGSVCSSVWTVNNGIAHSEQPHE